MKKPIENLWPLLGLIIGVFLVLALADCKKDDPITELKLPGVENLGRGYDFFGEYADVSSLQSPLIEFGNYSKEVEAFGKSYAIPDEVDYIFYNQGEFTSIYGSTIQEYQSNFSLSAGLQVDYLGFQGSVRSNFSKEYYSNSNYQFVTIQDVIRKWRVSLPLEPATLRTMLTSQASADLEDLSPEALFNKYGTFLLVEAVVGARADYNVSVLKVQEYSAQQFQTYAQASYDWGVGSVEVDVESEYGKELGIFRSEAMTTLKVKGGSSQYGKYIMNGDYVPWIESVADNPVLCDFTNHSLVPIWELAATETRKTELYNYFLGLLEENELPDPVAEQVIVSDVKIVMVNRGNLDWNDPQLAISAELLKPEGYKLLQGNMNDNHCSKALFLAYDEGTLGEEGIVGLHIDRTDNGPGPWPGYYKLEPNLDEQCNSAIHFYLYAKKGTEEPILRLKLLTIDYGEDPEDYLPDGFEIVTSEVNEYWDLLTGGDKIKSMYLLYSKQPVVTWP
ncbi:MAG: hypothetical protein KDC43_23910 [Saprospiraceae bacterium]|nr:hypothetical protein [Saprospiraceae bacterium]MCB0681739.1 hypothetical protein [Saprospiraceae bacterium]